jgi:tetratricopeptide (TPR) repeat protein
VAAHATTQPDLPLTELAGQLSDTRTRLAALAGQDPVADVRSVLSWSYRALSGPAARLFRLLGLHSGPDVAIPAAASLASAPEPEAASLLAELTRANLLTEPRTGRYTCHDLLRVYAGELVHTVDTDPEREAALGRMLDHYLHTAHTATQRLYPRDPIPVAPASAGVVSVDIDGYEQAMSWFAAESDELLAATELAATTGFDAQAWQIAWTLTPYLDFRGRWLDLSVAQATALRAAERISDPIGQAHAHHGLAIAWTKLGRFDDADPHHRRALELYRQLGATVAQANAHMFLGMTLERQGRHTEALDHAQQGLDLFRAADQLGGQAGALSAIGWLRAQLGDHRGALGSCHQALNLYQEVAHRHGESATWDTIGYVHHHLGQYREATASYQRALEIRRALGTQHGQATVLMHLGDTHHAAGRPALARDVWQEALDILERLDHPDGEKLRSRLQRIGPPATAPAGPGPPG